MHPSMHTDRQEPRIAHILVPATSLDFTQHLWMSEEPAEKVSPHSAHREEQADWLRMQQVTAAM